MRSGKEIETAERAENAGPNLCDLCFLRDLCVTKIINGEDPEAAIVRPRKVHP
jgi:hypothetical protein